MVVEPMIATIGDDASREQGASDPVQFDHLKRHEPAKPALAPAPILWLLGGVAIALAALPAIFDRPPASDQDEELRVFAAASMQNALDDINAAFTKSTGVEVIARYAASSALIKQVSQGAVADVFISADTDWMDWGL